MQLRVFAALTFVAVFGSACAKRFPEPTGVQPGTPHISWMLIYDYRDNYYSEFDCQSDFRTECVLPVSKSDGQVFSNIHFYFHGAGAETRYEGTINIAYLQGVADSHTSQTNITVKKNESITNSSTTGIVTSTPGRYSVDISLMATVVDTGKTQAVRQSVPVTVK